MEYKDVKTEAELLCKKIELEVQAFTEKTGVIISISTDQQEIETNCGKKYSTAIIISTILA